MGSHRRHTRSGARMLSPPFPTASSHCSLGDSLPASVDEVASDGYSNLSPIERDPSLFSTQSVRGPFHPSPEKSSPHLSPSSASPFKTPLRRRSSIVHTTPMSSSPRVFKARGSDNGVERALDNVMKTLKIMAMGTPRSYSSPPRDESRWSSSSEESLSETEESGFWRPRKSGESTRSRITIGTMSGKSLRSKKSRKSEETDRVEPEEDVPPVPVPVTPSRRKRMMEGLVKRLGLTPKKKHIEPEPEPITPKLPRKSSLSTLRSIAKKTSTGTLRSIRSAKSSHPFMGMGHTLDYEACPPLPRWRDGEHVDGCLPTTPRRRTPKSSIGQPRLQPSSSPSLFLSDLPRPAPCTPKGSAPTSDVLDAYFLPSPIKVPSSAFTVSLEEKLERAAAAAREATPELSPSSHAYDTPKSDISSIATPADVSFESPPLTTRAAQAALKPKRLLHLLPKQSIKNLGLQTPSSTGLRQKTAVFRTPLGDKTNIPLHLQGPNTPDSISSVLAKADRPLIGRFGNFASPLPSRAPTSRRDPLNIIKRYEPTPSPDLPFRGSGDGWGTPALGNESNRFEETFGRTCLVPDFTASPDASFSGDTSGERRHSGVSMESDLPTEEWELEAYLKELERSDRERDASVGVGC